MDLLQKSESLVTGGVDDPAAMPAFGIAFCLLSAAGFGAMGIFGKLPYAEGATVGTLLSVRFALAAALFWAIVPPPGRLSPPRPPPRRDVLLSLGLGAF